MSAQPSYQVRTSDSPMSDLDLELESRSSGAENDYSSQLVLSEVSAREEMKEAYIQSSLRGTSSIFPEINGNAAVYYSRKHVAMD